MDYLPSEHSVVINPITGNTMLGSNIEREISPNKPQPDELAYINRMRLHVKEHPSLRGSLTLAGKTNYASLNGYKNHSKILNSSIRGKELRQSAFLSNSIDMGAKNNATAKGSIRNKSVDFTSNRRANMHSSKMSGLHNLDYSMDNINDRSMYPYLQSQEKIDDNKMRPLKKSDIEGASPNHFKHKPKKYFVDSQQIKTIFNQRPGKYHGYLRDVNSGGTYIVDRPEKIFKWSLNSKKDINNRFNLKDKERHEELKYTNSLTEGMKNIRSQKLSEGVSQDKYVQNHLTDYTSVQDYKNYTPQASIANIDTIGQNSPYSRMHRAKNHL
ncbi:unnamed protein product [Moneuplotes crassus]|uniref:Uncharacterized protein n=1 Tax=Euplotes crassus TaxID=5936 RepID=A0AAD1UQK1_EUPCR|nr:unnamed protein product [Moneuplotes crassus]